MRVSSPVLGPVFLIEMRVLLAGLTLVLFGVIMRHKVKVMHRWRQFLIIGAFNAALPFTMIAVAELRLDAGLASVLNAMTPTFTALVSWVWTREKMAPARLGGVVLGVVGVMILVGWKPGGGAGHPILYVVCSLVAALSYGISGVFSAKYLAGEHPLDLAIGQQFAASLVLLPLCLWFPPKQVPSPGILFSVLMLAVFCTAVAYVIFFALLRRVGPLRTLSVTFLVPVFGVVWGALFLHEAVSLRLVGGLVVILVSVALVAQVRIARRAQS